jgi:hypothetical protein
MKTIKIISILLFLGSAPLFSQDLIKNNAGISIGLVPPVTDMYFDDPLNTWPDRVTSPVISGFYSRQVRDGLRFGTYIDYEKVNFTQIVGTSISSLNKYNIGLTWLSQYPKAAVHLQIGGYLGMGLLSAIGWDTQKGFEYGVIMGPAYEMNKLGFAIHVQYGRAWYESKGFPLGVMLYDPKILIKAYYRFADF